MSDQVSIGIKIGILVSGGGTNLQAIIDSCESGYIPGKVVIVISNKKDAYALERAKKHNIPALFINPKDYKDMDEYSEKLAEELIKREVDLVCLAGFLLKISPGFIKKFENRIMNIHPALLPCFGGPGMYGHHVHEAVIKSGVKISGCTVHFVDEEYDHGPIIIQKAVEVKDDDTPETLAERILKEEHKIYPEAIKLFAEGKLKIVERRVIRSPL
ncbi:MAG: phosphoribosylglycinamide formyltransferase [Endomicrobiia bacterium]